MRHPSLETHTFIKDDDYARSIIQCMTIIGKLGKIRNICWKDLGQQQLARSMSFCSECSAQVTKDEMKNKYHEQ